MAMKKKKHPCHRSVYDSKNSILASKEVRLEIQSQLADYDRKHATELDALILYVLNTEFGFGEKRLRRFYDSFQKSVDELVNRYCLEDEDMVWICTRQLKEKGIDLKAWHAEKGGTNV